MGGITGWISGVLRPSRNHAERLERRVGVGIAVLVPVFAVIGAMVMFSDEGPASGSRRVLCAVVLLSTVPVGAWWWVNGRAIVRMPGWFVFYADVGVATVLFTFAERGLALYATVLFAVIGLYIAYFSRTSVLRVHSIFVSAVIVVLAVATYLESTHDAWSVIAQASVSLLVVNCVIAFRAVIQAQLDLANTDSLTGLLNRRGFEIRVERLLALSDSGTAVTVFVVDLDRFKSVNDTRGHAAGDDVLRSTAQRLADAVPDGALVARTGGEEFTIAVASHPHTASVMADAIAAAVHEPADSITITGSVGAALLSVDRWQRLGAGDASAMVRSAILEADTAMYEAKRSGGNQARIFGD